MFYIAILSSITLSFIYWFKQDFIKGFFLFWYIVFLPTTKLLPEIQIPGFRFEILFGFAFLISDYFTSKDITQRQKLLFKQTKYARILIIMQAVFLVYEVFKSLVYPQPGDPVTIKDFFIFLTRNTLIVLIFIRVCYSLHEPLVRKTIMYALIIGLCLLGFSSFFHKFLDALGLNTGKLEYNEELGRKVFVSTGLFRGHPTQFAAFLGTGFGFAFAIFVSSQKRLVKIFSLFAMISCILGVVNSSKRAGILAFVVILLYYLFFERQNISKKTILVFTILIIGLWGVINFGDYLLVRFTTTQTQLEGPKNEMSRMAIWSAHVNYFIQHPEIWLIGKWWKGTTKVNQFQLASHSTFLRYLVYAGIPFFVIFYRNILNLIKSYYKFKNTNNFNFLYPIIGYIIPSTMNDNYDIHYLPLTLALGMAASMDNKLTISVLKQIVKESEEEEKEIIHVETNTNN